MGEKVQLDEHGWVDRLLPWFVNNTLDERERERVRRHLNSCDACQEAATLLSTVQSSVRHAIPMVPPPRTERLLASIDSFDRKTRRARTMAAIGVAASVAAALVVVALLQPDREQATTAPALYETTTSPAQRSSMDYVLDLEFKPGTSMAAQEQVLRGLEAKEINRSGSAGAYRITVSLPAASLEELERYTRDIESLGEIKSVNAVAVQLPMKRQQ
ncbi:MAG TPA: zf-HC2 domain-containing protein [Woeseiaceae bacterium]